MKRNEVSESIAASLTTFFELLFFHQDPISGGSHLHALKNTYSQTLLEIR